jgi:hypothetical protein
MSVVIPSLRGAIAVPGWAKNELWRKARAVPSLDLRFADSKSLVDATTGSSLVTFTRASSGTFVGSDGVLRTAVTNLLLQSEDFSTTWVNFSSTDAVNTQIAPNGSLTADELIEGSTSDSHRISQGITLVSGLSYTYSIYLKAATRTFAFVIVNGATTLHGVSVNLSTGAVSTAVGSPSDAVAIDAGNGWWRVSFTYAAGTSENVQQEVRLSTDGVWANRSYLGDNTSRIYLWGAQLEQSATVGEYIPTTSTINSAPRFDHNPTTGESLGLLVEEQRTNSIRNNTMVGAVAGTPGTPPTSWQYVTTSSNGLATSIIGTGVEDGINYIDYRFNGTTVASPNSIAFGVDAGSAATGQSWTQSLYWKLIAGSTAGVITWNLGIIENTAGGGFVAGAFYPQTAPTSAALGTQRRAATRVLSGGATVGSAQAVLSIPVSGNTAIDFTIRIGLPQLEQGAFATSPILTSTAAATRSADVASITGTAFSGWYRQDEGTVFSEGTLLTTPALPGPVVVLRDPTAASRHQVLLNSAAIVANAVVQASFSAAYTAQTKSGFAYALNNAAFVSNLTALQTDTTCLMPSGIVAATIGKFDFGGGQSHNGCIKRITYWPQRLTNSTLQQITQ